MAERDIMGLWIDLDFITRETTNQEELTERQRQLAASMKNVLRSSGVFVSGKEGLYGGRDGVIGSAERGTRFIQGTRLIDINKTTGIGLRNAAEEARRNEIELVSGDPSLESALNIGMRVLAISNGSSVRLRGFDHATPRHLEIVESFVEYIEDHSVTFSELEMREPKLPQVLHYGAPLADEIIDLSNPDNRSHAMRLR